MGKVYASNNKESQYKNKDNLYEYSFDEVDAIYIKQSEPTHRGNLLIEALPPMRQDSDVYKSMRNFPIYDIAERLADDVDRMIAIMRLCTYILPMPNNFQVDRYLSLVLRNGYVGKHINTKEYNDRLRESSSRLRGTSAGLEAEFDTPVIKNIGTNQNSGFSIIGISGGGKTTALESSMKYYPKVIRHYGLDDEKFLFTQLPIIKIDCSNDGNIKGICSKFFREIDYLLNTQYYNRYTKRSVSLEKMIDAMAHLAQYYAVGALVIDEIQHLKSTKSGDKALNFFVSVMNQSKVPIIYIGTYKAFNNILNKDFRQGRRSSGIGTIVWKFMEEDQEYDLFIEMLWKYQWLRNCKPLTEDIKKLLYKKSLGITDRIVKLFMVSQFEAIAEGEEELTYELIEKVADEKFLLTKHMIDAFDRKDLKILASLEDMVSPDIDQIFNEAIGRINIQQIADFANNETKKGYMERKQKYDELVGYGSLIDSNKKKVQVVAKNVIDELSPDTGIQDMRLIMVEHLLGSKNRDNNYAADNSEGKSTKKIVKKKDKIEAFNVDDYVGEDVGREDYSKNDKGKGIDKDDKEDE